MRSSTLQDLNLTNRFARHSVPVNPAAKGIIQRNSISQHESGQVFAGWYFCRPAWHEGFHLEDDSQQDRLYETIPQLLEGYPHVVRREIDEIGEWYRSPERFYHTYKMRRAAEYALPTVTGART